jgi:hypothetical protein
MLKFLKTLKEFHAWRHRGYSDQSPQVIKDQVLRRYAIPDATWVETGTFKGHTSRLLAGFSPKVYTLEPAPKLYARAARKFRGTHVEVINGTSEDVFPTLLPKLTGDICFWLDGHYSAGSTFQGATDCPIEAELAAIHDNLAHFDRVTILIDDIRACSSDADWTADYPTLDELVDWARAHDMKWRIEHDILIMGHMA